MTTGRAVALGATLGCVLAVTPGPSQAAEEGDALTQLARMTLEQLANVEVTSVMKEAQSLSSAPASIYVITRQEILASGALSIAEALRLAPNLQITQMNSTDYEIGARGFGGNREAQNFSNKILILIDGRSAYNPLFSGITYDAHDVLMDDIDRIEVISGPGATLWGANAMNGVINVITRGAADTQGGLVRATVGNQDTAMSARYGASTDTGAFRVYAKAFERGPSELADGSSAGDGWHKAQAGFRSDFGSGRHGFTLQGDYQSATFNKATQPEVELEQFDMLGRWEHRGDNATSRLQVFVDRTDRGRPPQGVAFDLTTYDMEFQQSLTLGERHRVVWGLGRRHNDINIETTPTLFFEPPSRRLRLTNVFAQDTISLGGEFKLTAGIKFEENSYSGWETLPDLRLSWAPSHSSLWWASAARAVRTPTPFDVDVRESLGGPVLLFGDPDFEPEAVWAYELGYRSQPTARVSWSASAFYNDYDDLRSIEGTPVTFFPLSWANLMEGSTWGIEAWANFEVTSWWRVSPGIRTLRKRLRFSEGAVPVVDVHQSGNDPRTQASLKSSMTFGRFDIDAMLRYVGRLPSPAAPDYTELSTRLSYRLSDSLELSLTGANLLDDAHREYAPPTGNGIRRAAYAELRWDF